MTVAVNFSTVASSIAGLTITGITSKGIDAIPDSASMLCPLLIPQPDDFITDISFERVTFGSNGSAKIDGKYSMHYVYLHCEIGSGINTYAPYAGIISNLELIFEKILSNDTITGLVDLTIGGVGKIGAIEDPAGNRFWGVLFSLDVLEHTQ